MMKNTKVITLAGVEIKAIRTKTQHAVMFLETEISAIGQKIKVAKFGLQKKALLAFFFLTMSAMAASAQKTVVLEALSKHGVDAGILNPDNFEQPKDYCFDLKQTTIAAGKEKTIVAKFNPAGAADEQWTVITVDGKTPSKGDINTFRKDQAKPATSNKTDESSYRIEKDSEDYLVISSKPEAASIPKDAPFMKDCRSYMTVNIRTKRVEQVQTINEKPVKIKILNVDKLEIIAKYKWDEQAKRYFTTSQNLNMQGKFLGQVVPVQTSSEYTNYVKK